MNVRTLGDPGGSVGLYREIRSRLLCDDEYRPQASGMPVSGFAGKQWSSILHGTGWAKHSHRDSALLDEAGFLSPSDEGEVRRSKQKMYFKPAPSYSPDVIDEEVQRILKELGLPTSRPRPMPPATVDPAPETDPIATAIAQYYRDQVA